MPRPLRIFLPGTPHHIGQRGHNRQSVFVADDDYSYYRENLIHFKKEFGCRIIRLLPDANHVHMVIGEAAGSDQDNTLKYQ
jgi:putative transposase